MKNEQLPYRDAREFLQARKKEIDSYGNASTGILKTFRDVTDRIKGGDHLGIVVALHKDSCLEKMLKILQYQHQQKRIEEIEKGMAILYVYANDCFLKFRSNYKPILDYFRSKIEKLIDNVQYTAYEAENKRYVTIRDLLKKFQVVNDTKKQDFERGKSLNEFAKELQKYGPKACFEECIFTWLRIQIEQNLNGIINKSNKQSMYLCCSLHFMNGAFTRAEAPNQNFSPNFPTKQGIERNEIKRQVVSYLNTTGGIHFIGIEYNAQKEARFFGIGLDHKDRQEALKLILSQVALKIFPSQDEQEDEDEFQQNNRLEKYQDEKKNYFTRSEASFNEQYKLTDYIYVDFLPIYDEKLWLYAREEYSGKIKYVIRIKVKLGDPYEVYHYINEKDMPEAYIRDRDKEKRLTMIEYYDEIYKRLKDKANGKGGDPPKAHTHCRWNTKPK